MQGFDFSHWSERLAQAPLSERHKQSFLITIRWYLSFCRRSRARVDHASARDFIAGVQKEKSLLDFGVYERLVTSAPTDRLLTSAPIEV